MASLLASIGRAQPARDMRNLLDAKLNVEQGERRERLTSSRVALNAEHMNQLRRKGQFEEQEQARLNRAYSIDALAPNMEGGPDGPMFKMMYRQAEAMGLVDKSSGGLGTITERDYGVLTKYMNETPGFVARLSRTRMGYWRSKIGEAQGVLKENPNDKKAQQALQQAQTGMMQATAQDKEFSDFMVNQEEEETRAQEKQEQFGLDERKMDETERHNIELEKAAKLKASRASGGKPTDFEVAYQQKTKDPEFAHLTRDEFRTKHWTKPSGELTDNAVLENIREIVDYDKEQAAVLWNRYLDHRKDGLTRQEALNKVQLEVQVPGSATGDYSYLWESQ